MRALRFISLTVAAVLLLTVNAFAGIVSEERIPLDSFESYGAELGTNWRAQNGTVPLVKTERGMSAKMESPSKMLELLRFFTPTKANESSVAFGCGIKFEGSPQINFYIKTNSGVEKSIVNVSSGVINCGSGSSDGAVLESGKWYDFAIEYNAKTGYIRCRVTDGTNNITVCGVGASDLAELIRIDFVLYKTPTIAYIDDVWLSSLKYDVAPYDNTITEISPAPGFVDAGTDKITVTFSQPPDSSSAENVKAGINGDESMIQNVAIEGNSLVATLAEPLDFGSMYMFEFTGLTLNETDVQNGVAVFYTKPLCSISDMGFSMQEIAPGELTGSATVSCDNALTDKALMLLALYDVETGNITAQHFVTSPISDTPVPMQASVTVADDGRKYKAVLYIWDDMYNMMALCQALELD